MNFSASLLCVNDQPVEAVFHKLSNEPFSLRMTRVIPVASAPTLETMRTTDATTSYLHDDALYVVGTWRIERKGHYSYGFFCPVCTKPGRVVSHLTSLTERGADWPSECLEHFDVYCDGMEAWAGDRPPPRRFAVFLKTVKKVEDE
jgi:hypothetical protein